MCPPSSCPGVAFAAPPSPAQDAPPAGVCWTTGATAEPHQKLPTPPPPSCPVSKQPGGVFSLRGKHHHQHVCSLLVIAQVLRLLLALTADPAAAQADRHLRAQLAKELKAAAAQAFLNGEQCLDARTLIKHLPAARLQQIRAAAKRRPARRGPAAITLRQPVSSHAVKLAAASTPSADTTDTTSTSSAPWQQQQPQQPSAVDVGCLLETTLMAAAVEAKLTTFGISDAAGLDDDASSPVDVEGVMRAELELAQLSGLV